MNPQTVFCPNHACPARGKTGEGNITIHSRKERRYRCCCCRKTFSHTSGTSRLRAEARAGAGGTGGDVVGTWLSGPQAIVAAFRLDERTVRQWLLRAGEHSQAVHDGVVLAAPRDLQQVQADEIKGKSQRGPLWLALAREVRTRLWLGGAVSPRRDLALIQSLVASIRQVVLPRPLLLAVDGLSSYVTAGRSTLAHADGGIGSNAPQRWPPAVSRRTPGLQAAPTALGAAQTARPSAESPWPGGRRLIALFCGPTHQLAGGMNGQWGLGCIQSPMLSSSAAMPRSKLRVGLLAEPKA